MHRYRDQLDKWAKGVIRYAVHHSSDPVWQNAMQMGVKGVVNLALSKPHLKVGGPVSLRNLVHKHCSSSAYSKKVSDFEAKASQYMKLMAEEEANDRLQEDITTMVEGWFDHEEDYPPDASKRLSYNLRQLARALEVRAAEIDAFEDYDPS